MNRVDINKRNLPELILKQLIILLFIPALANSQHKISGTVRDMNEAIPFCSIYLLENPSIGVSSNEKGEYILTLHDSLLNKHVRFSAIGYASFETSISALLKNPDIVLTERVEILEEVQILASKDEAGNLVQKAFAQYDIHFPRDVHQLRGFFREVSFTKDSVYLWLQEADLTVHDYAYKKDASKVRIQLHELRRSDDNRSTRALASFLRKFTMNQADQNNLYKTYQTPLRNYHHKILRLGESFVSTHQFYLEAVTHDLHDSLVVIRYESLYNTRMRNYTGRLTINLTDYSISQIEDLVTISGDQYYSLTKFRKIDNAYYPVFIKEISPGKDDLENEIQVRTIMFYEILTDKTDITRLRPRDAAKRDESLDNTVYSYHEAFWNTYEVYKDSQLPPRLITTLETKRPLTQQFKENGMEKK